MHGPIHLPAVRSLGAGANRPAAVTKLLPAPVTVDENAPLVEDLTQKKRSIRIDQREIRDVDSAPGHGLQVGRKLGAVRRTMVGERDQEVEVRASVLLATGNRAVEQGEANTTLGAQGLTKPCEQLPVVTQVLALARGKAKPPRSRAMTAQGSL